MKDIPLKTNGLNVFSINPKTVTKLSFKTKSENFNELYINIIGTYINSFKVYLSQENPSSSNTLKAQLILFNGYRFTINNDENHINTNKEYNLIIDNENQIGEIKIWLQYDNENILLKEADIFYDSIEKNKAHCYFFNLNQADIYKDLIISTTLFNGEGFIYMTRIEQINSNSIKLNYKNKDYSYGINLNKAIKITKDDIKFFEKNNNNEKKNSLKFC